MNYNKRKNHGKAEVVCGKLYEIYTKFPEKNPLTYDNNLISG